VQLCIAHILGMIQLQQITFVIIHKSTMLGSYYPQYL
jgi:hypothetical protein